MHSTVLNTDPSWHNPVDPAAGYAGVPREMTTVAHVMKKAGYKTLMAGKWDAGMVCRLFVLACVHRFSHNHGHHVSVCLIRMILQATPDHTPRGRGYDASLSFFYHCNDYYNFT
jgi:arylsulfatase B